MSHAATSPRRRGKSPANLALIDAAYAILAEINPATVRAVCYQLFNQRVIPSMAVEHTKRVSIQLTYAREHGDIPWEWIVDETREAERPSVWGSAASFAAHQRHWRTNWWAEQPRQVEVWSEKGTVRGTLAPILEQYAVTFRVLHGFGSATSVYEAAQDAPDIALYVGDFDPSGLWMSERDLSERVARYGNGALVDIRRIALTADDTGPGLPGFDVATKTGDARYRWFTERYGNRCWELDALSPVVLRDRVEQAILAEIDQVAWNQAARVDEAERMSRLGFLDAWQQAIRRPQP